MRGLVGFVLGLVAIVLVASRLGGEAACPAIGWSSALTVEVGPGWPAAQAVRVDCSSPCGLLLSSPADEPDTITVPLAGGSATVTFVTGSPDSVTATVLAADGAVLTVADLDVEWVRVGGSRECGGPGEAHATVPAP
ncbi:hypothetical protein [uncultured Modestobacter sp.]|uniref:hypothetical protein n=1 Tax=uncultured Modestobacter sp. TaxID=380048 RepID=UPI002611B901|nr:hypothetical protein [uncultured Modestobacter sp.]